MSRKLLKLLRRGGGTWISKNALLYDTFTTPDAAPITSPRTCEPGPGTLTISQTNNPFSIVGGELDVDQVAAAAHYLISADTLMATDGNAVFTLGVTGRTPEGTSRVGGMASTGAVLDGWALYGTSYIRPMVGVGTIVTGRTGAGPHSIAQVRRSATGVFHLYLDGSVWKLEWLHNAAAFGTYKYAGIYDYDGDFKVQDLVVLPLADYNSAWGGDWTEVTDTKTNPASLTTFDCAADSHINKTFTHEDGKVVRLWWRFTDASNYMELYTAGTTDLIFRKDVLGSLSTLATLSGVLTDGVSAEIDIISEGSSIKVFVDKVLKSTVAVAELNSDTGGRISHNLATNDIVITTHPYPALGIATSRVVAPQLNDTFTHADDFVAEIKNITLPATSLIGLSFRYTDDNNRLYMRLEDDGAFKLYEVITGSYNEKVAGVAGTLSAGDDVVLVADGTAVQAFVNGASIGTGTLATITSGTAGKVSLWPAPAAIDHIACFPRDVSGLLPKGSY